MLTYFPEQPEEITATSAKWVLRIIPYTHMRMVQRGIKQATVTALFQRFIESCATSGEIITTGHYTIFGRPTPRISLITLRADVDLIVDTGGHAHTVTIFVGRGEGTTEIGPI